MIIAQAPLRISLFGGGSDLPAFLADDNGAVLSFAIDKRVYVVGHPFTHRQGIALKYSKYEDVTSAQAIEHPIARVVLARYKITDIDIAIMSDVPAGTGLGSSSSFTVALLAFVKRLLGVAFTASDLAKEAIEIEVDILREPIGFQDQWAAALGGVNIINFRGVSAVDIERVGISAGNKAALERSLVLVPVGGVRSASALLQKQNDNLQNNSKSREVTRRLADQVSLGKMALLEDIDALGPLLHEAWQLKREISDSISSQSVDDLYDRALDSGSTGGKLLGAGGSGYLACYVPEPNLNRFKDRFPNCLNVSISDKGASVVYEN